MQNSIVMTVMFQVFSLFLVISSILVITSSSSVLSLVFLILAFLFASFLLFLLECEFLALLFIIVYVGAIAVLFLFAIMMLETKSVNVERNDTRYLPTPIIFTVLLLAPLINQIQAHFGPSGKTLLYSDYNFYTNYYQNWYDLIDSANDIDVYGQVLYSYYVLQFLLAGFTLLLVLIGAVYLTNSFEKDTTKQTGFKQLARKAKIFRD